MGKVKKVLLVSLILMILISSLGLGNFGYINLSKAYNHSATNILENVFESNGVTILPIIFKDSEQTIDKQYLIEQFKEANLTIENEEDLKDVIVTGDKIITASKTYTVLIYGDVNNDGEVDVMDADLIFSHYFAEQGKGLTGLNATAGNVINDDEEVDVMDAQQVFDFYFGMVDKFVLNEPISTVEKEKGIPVIKLKGANPQIIKLGTPYTELGATVEDDKDKNLTAKATVSVDTSKEGTNYFVKYNATDSDGNKAEEVKRDVIVKDYVKSIEIDVSNVLKEYQVGDKLDLTGGKINLKKASNKTESIDITSDMVSGFDSSVEDIITLTVTYSTTDTIDDKTLTVTEKYDVVINEAAGEDDPQTITPIPNNNATGYTGEPISVATVTSNKAIIPENFTYIIEKDGVEVKDEQIAKLTIARANTRTLNMTLTAQQAGIYKITVTPNIAGTKSFTVNLNINDVNSVKEIALDFTNENVIEKTEEEGKVNVTIREGQYIKPKIYFKNAKGENLTNILKNRIQPIEENNNVSTKLLDANDGETGGIEKVYMMGTAQTLPNTPIKITLMIDEAKFEINVTVLEKETALKVVGNKNSIELYKTKPSNAADLMLGFDEYEDEGEIYVDVYNLVQIYITENGVDRKLTSEQLKNNIKIKLGDEIISEGTTNRLVSIATFDSGKTIQTPSTNPSEYLGIRLLSKVTQEKLTEIAQKGLIIEYKYSDTKTLELELSATIPDLPDPVKSISLDTTIDGIDEQTPGHVNVTIREGEIIQPKIYFKNSDGDNISNIGVNTVKISPVDSSKLELKVLDAKGNSTGSGATDALYINGIGTTSTPINATVTVDDAELELSITILEKETALKVVGNKNSIELYKTKPSNAEDLMLGFEEYEDEGETFVDVYNLVQIYITENGVDRKLTSEQLKNNITIKLGDEIISEGTTNRLVSIATFDSGKVIQEPSTNPSEYLGIRLLNKTTQNKLIEIAQKGLTIEYNNNGKTLTLPLTVTTIEGL